MELEKGGNGLDMKPREESRVTPNIFGPSTIIDLEKTLGGAGCD